MHDKFIFMKVRFKRKRNFDYQEVNEMRTFEKSSKLDYVCYDIRGPIMDEAQRMSEQGIDILKLNIGNPAPFGFNYRGIFGFKGTCISKGSNP